MIPKINVQLNNISDTNAVLTLSVDELYNNCFIEYKTYDINNNVINDWTELGLLNFTSKRFEFDRIVVDGDVSKTIHFIDFRLKLLCGNA